MKNLFTTLIIVIFSIINICAQKVNTDFYNFDAQKYVIRILSLDKENKTMDAHTSIFLKPIADNQSQLRFDLINLEVDKVLENDIENTNFTVDTDGVTIQLAGNYTSAEEFKIDIYYHGSPFSEDWGGVYFRGDYIYNLGVGISTIPHNLARAWFPCFDNFSDKAQFEYYVTVPADKRAACGGVLIDVVDNNDGTHTYHYGSSGLHSTYLASFAVSDYELVEDLHQGVTKDIPIRYNFPQQYVPVIPVMFENIHEVISCFENSYGPYNFEEIGYTATTIGAMEHQNNIAFPTSALQNNLDFEYLYAHELSHSWFGNTITCASAEDMWINEGWATFSQIYYKDLLYGKQQYLKEMRSTMTEVLNKAHKGYSVGGDGGYVPLNKIPLEATYGISAYKRGAVVVHSLRTYMGDDAFFNGIKTMFENYKFTTMDSYQFRDALSESSGLDLTAFFDNYVFTEGVSGYVIDSCNIVDGEATIYIQQKLLGRSKYANDAFVYVTLFDNNLNRQDVKIDVNGKYGQKTFELDLDPAAIIVNYDNLFYDAKINNSKIVNKKMKYNFHNISFLLDVAEVKDSLFFHVVRNYVGADDTKVPEGYTISPGNYWQIDILPYNGSIDLNAKGIFTYSVYGLDSLLLKNNTDPNNYALLYRSRPGTEWIDCNAEIIGTHISGNIIIDSVKVGEYAMAVKDTTSSINDLNYNDDIKIFPNPATKTFNIELGKDSRYKELVIIDLNGIKVEQMKIEHDVKHIEWTPTSNLTNVYLFIFVNEDNKIVNKKGILMH